MKNRRVLLWVPLILFALSCHKEKPDPPAAGETPAPAPANSGLEVKDRLGPGMEFPHLAVADQMGNRYDLYNLLSKPKNVVLLIDAFCPACAEESQKIQRFAQLRPELNVIGVSKDSLRAVMAFKKYHRLDFPILLDVEKKLVPDYRRVLFPTLILVGPDRRVITLYEGEIPASEARPLLEMLIGQ
jgi:peroxiredoxin